MASYMAHTEASTGAELLCFISDEFDALLECGILAHGFLRLRCRDCGHDTQLAFSCKRRGFCPSFGARRMSQMAAHLVDHVIAHVPVHQWVLSLPIPLRLPLAAQPELVTPVLLVVQRVVARHLLHAAEPKADEGHGGAVTLIRRLGSGANLNVPLHCRVPARWRAGWPTRAPMPIAWRGCWACRYARCSAGSWRAAAGGPTWSKRSGVTRPLACWPARHPSSRSPPAWATASSPPSHGPFGAGPDARPRNGAVHWSPRARRWWRPGPERPSWLDITRRR